MEVPAWMLAAAAGIGSIAVGLIAYFKDRRTSSGTIQTTEAQALWSEASAFRLVQRDTIADQAAEIDRLEARIQALQQENGRLWAENRARRAQQ